MAKVVEYESFTITLRDDGIVSFHYKTDVLTEEIAWQIVDATAALVEEPHPILVVLENVQKVPRESREVFVGEKNIASSSSVALVVSSPVQRVIGNFFMGLNRPPIPAQLFSSEQDAVDWLLSIE